MKSDLASEVSRGYLNLLSTSSKAKYPKKSALPIAATGLLGVDLIKLHAAVYRGILLMFGFDLLSDSENRL